MTWVTLSEETLAVAAIPGAVSLRIGVVGPMPPPAGGMATQCQQLCELLHQEGLAVELVQTNMRYRPSWIARIRGLRAGFRLIPYLIALKRMCARADVVHVLANSGWAWHLLAAPAVWMACLHRVPVVVNYRGGDAERFLTSAPRWVAATIRLADSCVVPTGFLREVMARFGIPSREIPNIIDLDRFQPREDRRTDGYQHIIVTRNLEKIYGIDDALHAFRLVLDRYSTARLTVAGEGPCRSQLLMLASSLGISDRVTFAGRMTREAMVELYRSADVMVNPSTIDNMPNSILEAYATGVPVVSTNVGGVPYIARNEETALLVEARDPRAMADGICRLMSDPVLAGRLIRNARDQVKRYRWDVVRNQWLQLYSSLGQRVKARA